MININAIIEDLKCSVCLEYFNTPRTLNCQHSFCTGCLEKMFAASSRTIKCPQCRHEHRCSSSSGVADIAKNNILASLVASVQSNSAMCPECKKVATVNVCDHCKQIFCQKCHTVHLEKAFCKINDRLNGLIEVSKNAENLEQTYNSCEQNSYKKTIEQMDHIQRQLLSLWQVRKLTLVEQIRKFYYSRTMAAKSATVDFKALSSEMEDFNVNISKAKKESSSAKQEDLCDKLKCYEVKVALFEKKLDESFTKFGLDDFELTLHYNELNSVDVFKRIVDNVKLVATSKKTNSHQDLDDEEKKREVVLHDAFGKPVVIQLDTGLLNTVAQLKSKIRAQTGLNDKSIQLYNKKTSKVLNEQSELRWENGKIFLVKQQTDKSSERSLEEVEFFMLYKEI